MEYFNYSWAFVYAEAGENVMNLFRQRGLTVDDRDCRPIGVSHPPILKPGVAATCGLVAFLCDMVVGGFTAGGDISELSASRLVSFFIAFFVGRFISNVTHFVVESAVRTVIVCFVESLEAFEEHHAELREVMKAGWVEACPCPSVAGVWA